MDYSTIDFIETSKMENSENQIFYNEVNLDKDLNDSLKITFNTNNNSLTFEETSLPIDMQFNAGHVVSISVYSVLFVLSVLGMHTLLQLKFKLYILFYSSMC